MRFRKRDICKSLCLADYLAAMASRMYDNGETGSLLLSAASRFKVHTSDAISSGTYAKQLFVDLAFDEIERLLIILGQVITIRLGQNLLSPSRKPFEPNTRTDCGM